MTSRYRRRDKSFRWLRDMPEFLDIVLVMAKRDQIERAFGSLLALKAVEAVFAEHLVDGPDAIGAFGVPRRREMIEARAMRNKKRHAISRRVARAFREGSNLGADRSLGKSHATPIAWPIQFTRVIRSGWPADSGLFTLK